MRCPLMIIHPNCDLDILLNVYGSSLRDILCYGAGHITFSTDQDKRGIAFIDSEHIQSIILDLAIFSGYEFSHWINDFFKTVFGFY